MSCCRARGKMANERSSSDYPERDGTSSRSLQQPSMIGSEERLETNCFLVSKMRVQMAAVYRARTICLEPVTAWESVLDGTSQGAWIAVDGHRLTGRATGHFPQPGEAWRDEQAGCPGERPTVRRQARIREALGGGHVGRLFGSHE